MKKIFLVITLIVTSLIVLIIFYQKSIIQEPQKQEKKELSKKFKIVKKIQMTEQSPSLNKAILIEKDIFDLPPCEFSKKLNERKIDFDKIKDSSGILELYTSIRLINSLTSTELQINTDKEEARFIYALDEIKTITPRIFLNLYNNQNNLKTIRTK